MSLSSTTTITCPFCQKPGPFVMHQSVNVTLEPENKAKVLSGELFRFTCPACDKHTMVAHTVLYHDMERGLMIYLVPGDDASRNKVLDDLGPIPGPAGERITMRAVPEFNALKDKIFAFDAGVDDRLLEVTKLVIKIQNDQLRSAKLYFDRIEGDKLVLASVTEHGAQSISLSRAGTYTWAAEKLRAAGVLDQPLGLWPLVGERWAMWALDQIKG
jgi:hypothetical protein